MLYQNKFLELIKIANLLPHTVKVPDYATEIETRYSAKTGEKLIHGKTSGDGKDEKQFFNVISEIWNEIDEEFPQMAKYAVNASKSVLGSPIFNKIPENPTQYNWLMKEPEEVILEFFRRNGSKKITFYNEDIVTALKVENFIRLQRIRNNMRIVAYLVRKKQGNYSIESKNGIPPVFLPGETYSAWINENYNIFGFVPLAPFRIRAATGKADFYPNLVQSFIEKNDIYRIKTCIACYQIFWAKPKHSKYCSGDCRNRYNVKINYEKNKTLILKNKKKKYNERSRKNGTV